MKRILTVLLLLLFIINSFAQNSNKFMGVIKIQDTLIITYKVEFDELDGKISGYSLTDFGGEHETKSRIEGMYDSDKKMLSFNEVEIIYTKSTYAEDDFCNVYLEPTKFKLGSVKLFGKFKGRFNDGTECINGEIAMNSVEKIDKRVSKFTKKVLKSKRLPDSIKTKLRTTKLVDTENLNVLKKDEITSVPTKAKAVKCIIYDGGQIDNDIITVKQDGKIILYKYQITENKKVLDIPINGKSTLVTVIAESEGEIGENTAVIEIHDGVNEIRTMINLKKDDKTEINILAK